jgi:hypothetical protein
MRVIPTPRNVAIRLHAMLPTIQFSGDEDIRRDKSPLRSHVRKDSGWQRSALFENALRKPKLFLCWTNYPSRRGSRVNLSSVDTKSEEVHVLARGKLAAQHLAAHEMMQRKCCAQLGISIAKALAVCRCRGREQGLLRRPDPILKR